MSKPRNVVVVRVSEKGDPEDDHFHSPEVQIEAARGRRHTVERIPVHAYPLVVADRLGARARTPARDRTLERMPGRPPPRSPEDFVLGLQAGAGNRAVSRWLNDSPQTRGGAPLQRYTAMPTKKQWKKDTKRRGVGRSDELKAVDATVAEFETATSDLERRRALKRMWDKIDNWERAHPGSKRSAKVKELEKRRSDELDLVNVKGLQELMDSAEHAAYESAVKRRDLQAAFDEAANLNAQGTEFQEWIGWALGSGETNRATLAVRYFTAPVDKRKDIGDRLAAVADMSWMKKTHYTWVFENVIRPNIGTTELIPLLIHPTFVEGLRYKTPELYKQLKEQTPALQISAEARTKVKANKVDSFEAADVVFTRALGGQRRLKVAYIPTSTFFEKKIGPLTGGLTEDAELMCHHLATMFRRMFDIYAADAGVLNWTTTVTKVSDALLTKPVNRLQVVPGVGQGLVQKHHHPGNIVNQQQAPTGQIFFAPGDGTPAHSYVTLTIGGQTRSYDPIFGIAWDGDWRNNAAAGVDELFKPTSNGFVGVTSKRTVTFQDTSGAPPFTRRYILGKRAKQGSGPAKAATPPTADL